jgi:hypothetical protein
MREVPVYYQKRICKLSECKDGDWVFDSDGRLAYVTSHEGKYGRYYDLHTPHIETSCSGETIVYPVSLATLMIAEDMQAHRRKYYDNNIMCPDFSRELEEEFHNLMLVDITIEDTDKIRAQYNDIWDRMKKRLKERIAHARALHIYPKRKDEDDD